MIYIPESIWLVGNSIRSREQIGKGKIGKAERWGEGGMAWNEGFVWSFHGSGDVMRIDPMLVNKVMYS